LIIEVKWKAKELKAPNQIKYLKKHKGLLIALDTLTAERQNKLNDILKKGRSTGKWRNDSIDSKQFDLVHLTEWFLNKRLKLLKIQDLTEDSRNKKYWIVVLRGDAVIANWDRMEKYCTKHNTRQRFWAWSNGSPKTIEACLDMSTGDEMLFLVAKTNKNERAAMFTDPRKRPKEKAIEFKRWYKLSLSSSHLIFDNPQILKVFKDNKEQHERGWPHFVKFYIDERNEELIDIGPRGDFAHILSSSGNQRGAAVAVDVNVFSQLYSILRGNSND
jgi:hypothetical protein